MTRPLITLGTLARYPLADLVLAACTAEYQGRTETAAELMRAAYYLDTARYCGGKCEEAL